MDYEKRLQDAGIRVTAVRLLVYKYQLTLLGLTLANPASVKTFTGK